ncbi:MAG TPA: glycosyltransferase family A protein [Candidatus Polarisedimenticolaceae bacterium]|nr:glycosyltransferase family A protein [Candidatus Polarisedimenticolaceae bacterium]
MTVVIPTRQRAHVLPTAMESVLGQDVPALRLLVCDNASEDGTAEVVRRYAARDPRVVFHRHPQDIGATANFQWGMDAVGTDHFLLLSDDDALLPGFLARALRTLRARPEAAMFCGASVVYDTRTGEHRVRPDRGWEEGVHAAGEHVARILEHHFLWTGVVFHARVRETLGRFEPVPLVDVLYLAKAAASFPFAVSLLPGAVFRMTGTNAHLTVTPSDLERTRITMQAAVRALPLAPARLQEAQEAVEDNVRGVANRALREAYAARRMDAHAALAAYMDGCGWLSAGKRLRVALKRRLGPGRRPRRARPALSFEDVVRMYAAAPEENP